MGALDPFAVLPVESSLKILAQNFRSDQELVLLWTQVRNVSKTWRAIVDDYVWLKHLPATSISFSLQALPLLDDRPHGSSLRTNDRDMVHLAQKGIFNVNFTFNKIASGDCRELHQSTSGNMQDQVQGSCGWDLGGVWS